MSVNVQEFYQQVVRSLSERERLELLALIATDLAKSYPRSCSTINRQNKGDIAKFFGSWKGGAADESNNEKIDADLARACL